MNLESFIPNFNLIGISVLIALIALMVGWRIYLKSKQKTTSGLVMQEGQLENVAKQRKKPRTILGVMQQQQYATEDIAELNIAIHDAVAELTHQRYVANLIALEELKSRPEVSSVAIQNIETSLHESRHAATE